MNGLWPLNKTVAYTYDVNVARVSDAGLPLPGYRISKTLAVPGKSVLSGVLWLT